MIEKIIKTEVWAIVLAAGMSRRMHTQKLLLPFGGKTVIESVIDNILNTGIDHIMVVLGSHREKIARILRSKPVTLCFNDHYSKGMHTSVICGFRNLPESARAAVVFLGDQPLIPAEVIGMIIHEWQQSGKGIIIPSFRGKCGHPTLFDMKFREAVIRLNPAYGLRSVIARFPEEVQEAETNFPEILRDIDTKNDYLNELNQLKK